MVEINDACDSLSTIEKENIASFAQKALDLLNRKNDSLTIVLSDDKNLHLLNNQFSGNNYPTDVLSFTANEVDPITGQNYLGDVIISMERAASQAAHADISPMKELATLIIHGILHLCGYDHTDEKTLVEMFAMQGKIINNFEDFLP